MNLTDEAAYHVGGGFEQCYNVELPWPPGACWWRTTQATTGKEQLLPMA